MKKKRSKRVKVIKLTARRREAMDVVKFNDGHGGKLGAFRAYQQVTVSKHPVGRAREVDGAGAMGHGK